MYLCEQGADKVHADTLGATPLGYACSMGHVNVVRYLGELGTAKEHADTLGASSLFDAGLRGLWDVVRYLCEQGADKEHASSSGGTPLRIASQQDLREGPMCFGEVEAGAPPGPCRESAPERSGNAACSPPGIVAWPSSWWMPCCWGWAGTSADQAVLR